MICSTRAVWSVLLGVLVAGLTARAEPPAILLAPGVEPGFSQEPTEPSTFSTGFPSIAGLLKPPAQPTGAAYAPGSAGPYAVSAGDPIVETASAAASPYAPGWFGSLTLGVVKPHVSAQLSPAGALPLTHLPLASLDWTLEPRVEVGYHLEDNTGDLRLGYRLLLDSGLDPTLLGNLHNRVALNCIDFDYVSREWLSDPTPDLLRDLRIVAGLRLANARLTSSSDGIASPGVRSTFLGIGPRFGLEWRQTIPETQFGCYARADVSGLLGHTSQTFDAGGFDVASIRQGNGAASFSAEVGFSWQPAGNDGFRVVVGYQFEQWWNLGRTDFANADLTVHGGFLRGEWRY
jgi:Legionella pneumophila major outer membrane protein precursor